MNNIFKIRFKKLRNYKSLSQTEIGTLLNISQMQISKYELGESYPSVEGLIQMAKYFNVTTDYLLGLSNYYNVTAIDELHNVKAENNNLKNNLKNWKETLEHVIDQIEF